MCDSSAYKYTSPGIVFDIYTSSLSNYSIPGPAVWSGSAGGSIAIARTSTRITTNQLSIGRVVDPPPTSEPGAQKYQQCGGNSWKVSQ